MTTQLPAIIRILLANAVLVTVLGVLSGCASTGRLLSPSGYRSEATEFRQAAEQGASSALKAANRASKKATGRDKVLFILEEGRLRSLAGDIDGSTRLFQEATDLFEKERQEPVISASEAFFSAAALATNDRFLSYQSAGFERLMAHNFLALNFLRQNKADLAQIALNAGIAEMDYQGERTKALARKSDQKARQSSLTSSSTESTIAQAQAQLQASALPGLASYQSAFTFYLASALFELQGDYNRSEIAMRRAGELYPTHPAILDVIQGGWRKERNDALIVVISAEGWVPLRDVIKLPLYWDGTLLQIVMPTYTGSSSRWGRADTTLTIDSQTQLSPAVITDLGAQVRQDLADQYPAVFLRQGLRLVAKYQIQKQLEEERPAAGFAAQVFNLLTDQADLRSWSTLPATLQVAHYSLPAGKHQLRWDLFPQTTTLDIDLPSGSTLFLIIEQVGTTLQQETILFER